MNIKEILKETNKKYGKDTAVIADEKGNELEAVSTGCYSFDKILGVGGIPLGRIIDLYGMESQGKSTVALHIAAQFQKANKNVAWIDAEACFSAKYSANLGVNVKNMVLIQPENGENAMNILIDFVNKGVFGLIVVDSTANITPQQELEGNIEKHTVALQARLIGKALRAITAPAAKNNTTVLFISQLRNKIGMFAGTGEIATGGLSLKFYSSIRMKVKTIKKLKNKDELIIGNRLRVKVEKNKVANPFGVMEVDLYFDSGIDIGGDIFDIAVEKGFIIKEGNTFFYEKKRIGVGRDNARNELVKNQEMFKKIKKII